MKIALSATAAQPPAADLAGDGDSTKDEIRMTDNKQYPPLPDFEEVAQHVYWVSRGYIPRGMLEPIHELMRAYLDADRAMRAEPARQPERIPLTNAQLVAAIKAAGFKTWDSRMWELKRLIEAAHDIKPAKEQA